MTDTATPAVNAPADMTAVITNAVADAVDSGELPGDANLATDADTVEADAGAPAAVEATAADAAPAEEFESLPVRNEHGRVNRIPYDRVKTIVENAKKKVAAEWESKLSESTSKASAAEGRLGEAMQLARMIHEQPEAFLAELRQVPAYASLLGQGPKAESEAQSAAALLPPDYRTDDGGVAFSPEAVQRMLAKQASEVEERITKRFAPIEQRFQAETRLQAAQTAVRTQLEEAASWPGFTEGQNDILRALQADPQMTLEGAWRKVVVPKMAADRDRIRQEVLAELNAKPRSTATAPNTPVPTAADDAPTGMGAVIWKAMRDASTRR